MRNIFIILIFAISVSCTKTEWIAQKIECTSDTIIYVNLSPNSPVLIADGKATLKFKVKAFTEASFVQKVEETVDGETKVVEKEFKEKVEINSDRISKEDIKIYKEDGTPVDWEFTTTDLSSEYITFIASVKGVESAPRKVRIIESPKEEFEPITVPIIFHLIYKRNFEYQYENINTEMLQRLIDRANKVFSNSLINAPSAIDTKIKFVLAENDEYGKLLKETGINRVVIGNDDNYYSYIDNNIWDLNKFLNIIICDEIDMFRVEAKPPLYILNNGSNLEMDYFNELYTVNDESEAFYFEYSEVCIGINKTTLYKMDGVEGSFRFETALGQFYGLLENGYMPPWTGKSDDFCSDTYTYFTKYRRPEKWTFIEEATNWERKDGSEIYFDSFNIMDEYSTCTTITYEQALRIRTVIENCPFRMMRE